MRRKPIPNPIERGTETRPLAPARVIAAGLLPTIAVLAVALAGCSAPQDDATSTIQADPTSHAAQAVTTAPSSSAGSVDPTPIQMPGDPAPVAPLTVAPVTKATPRPYIGRPVPSSKPPKLGGKPLSTQPHPWTT